MSDVIQIRKHKGISEGGSLDEARARLLIYADDLDPDVVSARIGCAPTEAQRKGERTGTQPPCPKGRWCLQVEGKAPAIPDELFVSLLAKLPSDPTFWAELRRDYEVRIDLVIHTGGWNRGFVLRSETVAMLASTGVPFGVDLYFYGDEEDI